MSAKINKKDINILDNLLTRTGDLPDILHLRAAEWGYELTEDDKTLLLDTYQKLDDILKEVAAFVNIKFPGCARHIHAWNQIDFDTKIGPFKIITNDREHIKREWRNGLFDLKSLIKDLKNEAALMVDDDNGYTNSLASISSDHPLAYYTDETNIPNQELVSETIVFFEELEGRSFFEPLQFLNLLDKQYGFVKMNFDKGEMVVQHLAQLPLSDREKHTLYGFILKWFGGYPVNNLNEDFNRTLKLIQKAFLAFEGQTPEKEYCRVDQEMRNKMEMLSIAMTTSINHNIDVSEILAAMEPKKQAPSKFEDFEQMFDAVAKLHLVGPFKDLKESLIAQSAAKYEFNVWLQTHKDWEYRDDEQYQDFLNVDVYKEFLDGKKSSAGTAEPLKNEQENTLEPVSLVKPTLKQIALICNYTDRVVTRANARSIAKEYGHNSGDALFNHFTRYRSKANRIGTEDSAKKNAIKIQLLESITPLLLGNEAAHHRLISDLSSLKQAVAAIS